MQANSQRCSNGNDSPAVPLTPEQQQPAGKRDGDDAPFDAGEIGYQDLEHSSFHHLDLAKEYMQGKPDRQIGNHPDNCCGNAA